jgi:PAS domain S-box-containing protein
MDTRTATVMLVTVWLAFSALSVAVWWTRRQYPGFGRFAMAGPGTFLAALLLGLRGSAPDWLTVVCANGLTLWASALYLDGARLFRNRPPIRWSVYAGVLVTIGAVAVFTYVRPSMNARAALMSASLAMLFLLTAIALVRAIPPGQEFGLRLIGGLFGLGAATHAVRATYFVLGPSLSDSQIWSGVGGALSIAIVAEMALFPLGFMLAVQERMVSDLRDASARMVKADAELSQQKEAEAVLRESERLFRTMANAAPVMIWMSGTDTLCTYFNRGWLDFTGRPLEAELGNGWVEGVHADDRETCLRIYIEAFDRREPFHMEYRLRRRDGEYRWIFDQGVPRVSGDGKFVGYIGSGVDVTERRLAEDAMATVSRRLVAAQEEERARIARELHDDIGQQITLLTLDLEHARRRGGLNESADILTDGAKDRVQHLARSVHNLTHRLHPQHLEIIGLVSALGGLARELSRPEFTVAFAHDGIPEMLPPEITITLFRVVQEALQNAIKHSGAHHVSVQMSVDAAGLRLMVADDGVGFDVDRVQRRGLGLVTMRERLELIGGSLSIMTRPGAATHLHIMAPLPASPVVEDETRSPEAMSEPLDSDAPSQAPRQSPSLSSAPRGS